LVGTDEFEGLYRPENKRKSEDIVLKYPAKQEKWWSEKDNCKPGPGTASAHMADGPIINVVAPNEFSHIFELYEIALHGGGQF
jgi:hypothetical protein